MVETVSYGQWRDSAGSNELTSQRANELILIDFELSKLAIGRSLGRLNAQEF